MSYKQVAKKYLYNYKWERQIKWREREREEDATVWKIVREDRREMESGGGGRVYA